MTAEKEMSCLDCGKPRGKHLVFTGYCDGCAERHSKRLSVLNQKLSGAFFGASPPAKQKGRGK